MLGVVVESIEEIDLDLLLPHEQTEREKVERLAREIEKEGLKNPIVVAKFDGKYMIVDGHHRSEAFGMLGKKKIKAVVIDYFSHYVKVVGWKDGRKLDKTEILRKAWEGKRFPPKTTKHLVCYEGKEFHVSMLSKWLEKFYQNRVQLK